MARTGRGRLIGVTALTVASLLLGTGAINALAEGGHGNANGRANGQANAQQAQTVSSKPGNSGHENNGNGHGNSQTAAQGSTSQGTTGHGDEHGNSSANGNGTANHAATTTSSTSTASVTSAADKQSQDDVERDDKDDNDLVTPPGRVTEEKRPGLGCGDADDHTGAPGNPGKECKHPHDNDGDASIVTTADTSDDMVATETDTDSSVASDDTISADN